MKTVLTIAGSDCSGGAGIEADLKTFMAYHVYGMSVITALTAQNTTGVQGILEVPSEFVEKQMDSVCSDILPDAVKIGMIANAEIAASVADRLQRYQVKHIVIDPVMVSTSGRSLVCGNADHALYDHLMSMAELITPNMQEATVLSGLQINTETDQKNAAEILAQRYRTAVLIKGGHREDCADDLLFTEGRALWIRGKRIDTENSHGTGCTLSSAIAANLALGKSLSDSIKNSKAYVTKALNFGLNLGHGNGPLNHSV